MTDVERVGIDLGKQVFHLTVVDGAGRVLERARLRRAGRMAVRNRTAQANQLHGFLLEWGIGSPLGRLPGILEDAEGELTPDGRALLSELGEELRRLDERVKRFDARIEAVAQADPACRRPQAIPGIGPLTATAPAAAVGDPSAFRNGRELAAWLGLAPRRRSTGGRTRLCQCTPALRVRMEFRSDSDLNPYVPTAEDAHAPSPPLGSTWAATASMKTISQPWNTKAMPVKATDGQASVRRLSAK